MKVGTMEIAKILGVTVPTIYNWKKRGMPFTTEVEGLREVSRYDVEACKAWRDKEVSRL